jgi:hypothetical protein
MKKIATSKSKQKKLNLQRETIALLTSLQLSHVAGGDITGDNCDTPMSRTGPCDPR